MSKTYSAGIVTAYGAAKRAGYQGTYEDFCRQQAQYAQNASAVEQAKQTAVSASQSANQAKQDAQTASTTAQQSAQSAQGSAQSAGQSAQDAQTAKNNAQTYAQSASQSAGSAQQSAQTAQAVFESIPEDYSDLSEDVDQLKADLGDLNDWIGYAPNVFDARDFITTHAGNWSIDSATRTSITITHKTTYSTGAPVLTLDLPTGDYVFNADYTNSSTPFSFRVNGIWKKSLTDGAIISIDSNDTNEVYFNNAEAGTYTITNISLKNNSNTGVIPSMQEDVANVVSGISALQNKDSAFDVEIAKINESLVPVWVSAEAVSTTANKIITSEGAISDAGSEQYLLEKYFVTPFEKYKITGSTAWKNLIYAFFDTNDTLVLKGTESASGGTDTVITDELVTAPAGASYVLVAYHRSTLTASICKYVSAIVPDKSYLRKWVGKKWVCVGDSLTAVNDRTTKHYFDYVAENTGISVLNMGVSGTGYGRRRENNEAFYQRISNCPSDTDVVTIFGSFNDLGAGLSIGTVDDTGTDTLAGCINTTINNLQAVIPLVNLGIVAPTPWDTTQPSTSGQAYNYVEMLKAICARRSIPFLDLWRGSNLRPWDADFRQLAYSKDGGSGTHPDETGHAIIAPRFKAFLESLIM